MMASASSAVIIGGASFCVVGSAGSASADGVAKPAMRPATTALPASPPAMMRRQQWRFLPVCNVIHPPATRGEPNSGPAARHGSLLGTRDLGAYRHRQPLVSIRIGIQIPGVTRRLGDTFGPQCAD